MSTEKWPQIKEIVDAAMQRKPQERSAFLDHACDGDEEVRKEVESLLSSFGRAEGFMEGPVLGNLGGEITEELKTAQGVGVIGRYEIIRELGVGGMGVVYLAKDTSLGRHVAIKLLNKRIERNEENVRRFLLEARAASALNHPNILTIHEIGEFEGSHYIVSEFVDGVTLREVLNEGRLEAPRVIDLAIQMAGALAAAHAAKIIHRDIKPENIVVRKDGFVKILDFGLAKLLPSPVSTIGLDDDTRRQNKTAQGLILGTVSYMSPEQAKAESVDERTDIFSLGVVMYEMFTGRTPFAGSSTAETFANLIHKDAELLDDPSWNLPDGLAELVSWMLEKEPEARCAAMSEVAAALKDLKAGRVSGSELARMSSPNEENLTKTRPRSTGESVLITSGGSMAGSSTSRRLWYLGLISALVIGAGLTAWLLYPRNVRPRISSLAVLPLRSLDSVDPYMGLGITDAIIRKLSISRDLVVRPTAAISRFMTEGSDPITAAKELGVEAVVEGTLQAGNDRIRADVRLLSVNDGSTLWSESFEAAAADVTSLQENIAKRVAAQLKMDPDAGQQGRSANTANQEGYLYYTKAMFQFANAKAFFNKDELVGAMEQFERSIQLDPDFALAHAQYGYAYALKAIHLDGDQKDIDKANELLRRAESLDPRLPDVHVARSFILNSQYSNWNVTAAIRELRMAQDLDPNAGHNELSELYWHLGLEDQWRREKELAMRIDPTSDEVKNTFVNELYLAMLTDEGLEADKKYFGRGPDATYYFQKRMFKEAGPLIEEMYKKDPNNPAALDGMAILRAGQGRHKEAAEFVQKEIPLLKNNRTYHHYTYDIACVYALAGNTDEALKWLRTTAAAGFTHYPLFQRDWALDPIRKDPKFIAYMNDVREQWERNNREYRYANSDQ